MIHGRTKEESIRLTAEAYGIDERQAALIVAFELGEIHGDVIESDIPAEPRPVEPYKPIRKVKEPDR